jgi:4-alpha-glucanotransferase
VPANPRHYWRYRMHLTLEALMHEHAFNTKLRTLIDETARY